MDLKSSTLHFYMLYTTLRAYFSLKIAIYLSFIYRNIFSSSSHKLAIQNNVNPLMEKKNSFFISIFFKNFLNNFCFMTNIFLNQMAIKGLILQSSIYLNFHAFIMQWLKKFLTNIFYNIWHIEWITIIIDDISYHINKKINLFIY